MTWCELLLSMGAHILKLNIFCQSVNSAASPSSVTFQKAIFRYAWPGLCCRNYLPPNYRASHVLVDLG